MKLCFGTFLSILEFCKLKSISQKVLCGTVLLSVAPQYDIRGEDGTVSDLKLCKKELSSNVTDLAPTADKQNTSSYFKHQVLPYLDDNKRSNIILALKDVIASDCSIKNDTVVDRVSGMTKADIIATTTFILEDFLAGIFLYATTIPNNRDGEPYIKSINEAYIKSFDSHTDEITLDSGVCLRLDESSDATGDGEIGLINTIAKELVSNLLPATKQDNSLLITLLSESNGNCLRCGKALGINRKNAVPMNNCEIMYFTESTDEYIRCDNAVALCKACVPYVPRMTDAEKQSILSNRKRLAAEMITMDDILGVDIADGIESVLREIEVIKNEKDLANIDITGLVELDKKIDELYLRSKIDSSMARLFNTVNDICARLEQETGFSTERFGRAMKYAYETIKDEIKGSTSIETPQEYIANALIKKLYITTGQKYQSACEIIVAYLIKRCDLFSETT